MKGQNRFRFLIRRVMLAAAVFTALFSLGRVCNFAAAEGEFVREPLKALFISIEAYEKQGAELKYAKNDISEFSTLLQTKFAAKSESIIDQPGDFVATGEADCYKNAIEEKIKQWCGELNEDETAILYIAGHGVLGDDGKLYLPMRNWDGNRDTLPMMGIALEWVRETYGAANAKCKLILLDTCYSGTSRGVGIFEVSDAVSMAQVFDKMDRMTTVASSQADQQSYLWNLARHSLFTYWLIQAFDGDADLDDDHFIALSELTDYLTENVTRVSTYYEDTSGKEEMKEQTPAVLNADGVDDLFRIPVPAFTKLNDLVEKLAKQIDLKMRMNGCGNILVAPKFVTGEEGSETIDPSYGTLPSAVAIKFAKELQKLNSTVSNYTVFGEKAVKELLEKEGIRPEDLGGGKTENLTIGSKQVKTILTGRIDLYAPSALKVTVELFDAEAMESLAVCSGEAALNAGDLAANGASFVRREALEGKKPDDTVSDPAQLQVMEDSGLLVPAAQAEKIREDTSADQHHPMMDSSLPFGVKILVRKKDSNAEFEPLAAKVFGNDCYVPLNAGEEYEIELENKNDFPVWARVLVDGKSTLAQRMTIIEREKGVTLEASKESEGEMVLAPRVALEDARAYYLKAKRIQRIIGFGWPEKGITNRFEVTDSLDDISPDESYDDKIGWITIGFFKDAVKGARGMSDVRTKIGTGVSQKYDYVEKTRPGELIAVYNIRYVSQKQLDSLTEEEMGKKAE